MPTRTRRPAPDPPAAADRARDRIVQAATSEFALRGFDGARIDAIAREAGVNKALLYYYFPSKQELYRRLVIEHLESVSAALRGAVVPGAPEAETLGRCVQAVVELFESRPLVPRFILREVLNGWGHLKDEDFFVLRAASVPIVSTVERGIESGAFRTVPPILVHFLAVATVSFFFVSRDARSRGSRIVGDPALAADTTTFLHFLTDTLLRGLAAEPLPAAPSGAREEP